MKIKRFTAQNMRNAMEAVREAFGPDAVILSTKSMDDSVEIVAAMDYDEKLILNENPSSYQYPDTTFDPLTSQRRIEPVISKRENVQKWEFDDSALNAIKAELAQLSTLLKQQQKEQPLPQQHQQQLPQASIQMPLIKQTRHLGDDTQDTPDTIETTKQTFKPAISAEYQLIYNALISLNLDVDICDLIMTSLMLTNEHETNLKNAINRLEELLPIVDDDILERGGVLALVGTTGVGKTTTVAKLAARFVLKYPSRHLGIITMDTYRIGATQQLQTYGNLIGVPVHVVDDREKLNRVLTKLADKQLILIDTAGMGPHDKRLQSLMSILYDAERTVTTSLVIPATIQAKVLKTILSEFSVFNPKFCMLSKIDEGADIGQILSVLIRSKLPIAYLTDGQRVPEDLHKISKQLLLDGLANQASGTQINAFTMQKTSTVKEGLTHELA